MADLQDTGRIASLLEMLISKPTPGAQLPPWVENTYFDLPSVTVTPISSDTVWTQIIGEDIQRTVLIISGSFNQFITPDPTIAVNAGLQLTSTNPTLVFTQSEHALLAATAWWGVNNQNTNTFNITCLSLRLRRWPGYEGK